MAIVIFSTLMSVWRELRLVEKDLPAGEPTTDWQV
jgi:hypothetical protein